MVEQAERMTVASTTMMYDNELDFMQTLLLITMFFFFSHADTADFADGRMGTTAD